MTRLDLKTGICAVSIALVTSACAPLTQYRTEHKLCENPNLDEGPKCERHALQIYQDPDKPDVHYTLGFIEFDDQGLLIDRGQLNSVLKYIGKLKEQGKDSLIVVFMHGWHHSAAPGDRNIADFRSALEGLRRSEILATQRTEQLLGPSKENAGAKSASEGKADQIEPREVVGVYLGWRGDSLKSPWLNWSTFWERKDTAQTVGHVGLTEVLTKLEKARGFEYTDKRNKLIVIGHSFGGAAVFSALTQILESRFVRSADLPETGEPTSEKFQTIDGFGDLVVLVNPAFEALLFQPLKDMSTEYGKDHDSYPKSQLPVLAVLTSEGDTATKNWFRRGRWFTTLLDREGVNAPSHDKARENLKKEANMTALGQFKPYQTHFLHLKPQEEAAAKQEPILAKEFFRVADCWQDGRYKKIEFDSTVLEQTDSSPARNPYLIVQVDDQVIDIDKQEGAQEDERDNQHNDVWDAHLIDFVKQLILISSQTSLQADIVANPNLSVATCRVGQNS